MRDLLVKRSNWEPNLHRPRWLVMVPVHDALSVTGHGKTRVVTVEAATRRLVVVEAMRRVSRT